MVRDRRNNSFFPIGTFNRPYLNVCNLITSSKSLLQYSQIPRIRMLTSLEAICLLYFYLFFFRYCTSQDFQFNAEQKRRYQVCLYCSHYKGKKSFQYFTIKYDVCHRYFADNLYQINEAPVYSQFAKNFLKITNGHQALPTTFTLIEMFICFFLFMLM